MQLSPRLRTGWELARRAFQVIRKNPRLFLFPVASVICSLVLVASFLAPVAGLIAAINTGHASGPAHAFKDLWDAAVARYGTAFYAYAGLIYLLSMFAATFFNVAFYHEILSALAGGEVSLGRGLRFACGKIGAIATWSLFAGTVGLVIRSIENRLGWMGKIVLGLIGVSWSVASVFAIPVIIRRTDSNPLAVLRDSAGTLKKTWGESLAGFVGIQLGVLVFMFIAFGLSVPAIVALRALAPSWLIFANFAIWSVAVAVAALFNGVANSVYRCALYVYASEGVVPEPFTLDMMNAAWRVKKG